MRTPIDALVTEHALRFMSSGSGAPDSLLDAALEQSPAVKNVCAKVSVHLSDEIDQIVGLLSISKRRFLEAAFIEAVDRAKAIIDEEGLHEYLDRLSEAQTAGVA